MSLGIRLMFPLRRSHKLVVAWFVSTCCLSCLSVKAFGQEPSDEHARLLESIREPVELDDLPADVLFHFLDESKRLPQVATDPAEAAQPMFAQLVKQSAQHRGATVRLRGTVRRIVSHQQTSTDSENPPFHEAWLFTEESKPYPYVAIVSELDEGLAASADLTETIELTGTFLCMVRYRSVGGHRRAPLIVAHRLRHIKPPQTDPAQQQQLMAVLLGATIAGIVGLAGMRMWGRSRQRQLSLAGAADRTSHLVSPKLLHSLADLSVPGETRFCLPPHPTDSSPVAVTYPANRDRSPNMEWLNNVNWGEPEDTPSHAIHPTDETTRQEETNVRTPQ